MNKYTCFNCKSQFYADQEVDDFQIAGLFFCSHCYPKAHLCSFCDKVKIFKKIINNDTCICDDCKKTAQTFPNVWMTLRFKTFARDNFTCRYCGRSPLKDEQVILHCDHIIPKSKNGGNSLHNLITACKECNYGKIDVLLSQYHIDLLQNRKTNDSIK